MKIERSHVI